MSLLSNVGNFFGGLLGKKKEEEERRAQATVRRPASISLPNTSTTASPRMPGSLVQNDLQPQQPNPMTPINLGGVKMAEPREQTVTIATPKPKPAQPENDGPNWGEGFRRLADAPGEFARGTANSAVDIVRAIPRALVSTGLQLTNRSELKANNPVERFVLGDEPIKNLEDTAREGVNTGQTLANSRIDVNNNKYSTTEGTAGNSLPSIAALPLGLLFAAGDLNPVTGAGKKALKDVAEEVGQEVAGTAPRVLRDATRAIEPEARLDADIPPANEAPTLRQVQAEGAIKPVQAAETPAAITSPNRPPTVEQPKPVAPQPTLAEQVPVSQGVRMSDIVQPRERAAQIPNEALADASRAIDEATAQAPIEAAPVRVVESPEALQARAIADGQVPAVPVNEADLVADAVNQAPTDAIADAVGSIGRNAALRGDLVDDAAAQATARQFRDALETEAQRLGTSWDEINRKIQTAWSKQVTDPAEAGLTPEEFDLATRAAAETGFLRSRVDPALLGSGYVDRFYSPRQTPDTEFTQELVNEISRSRTGGLVDSELDLSATPYEQTFRRYANADQALTNQLVDLVENRTVKDANGNDILEQTGIKLSDETKADVQEMSKGYVQAQDDATRAIEAGDEEALSQAIKEGDDAINAAINRIADEIPLDQMGREAIDALKGSRGAYLQSTMRTNMFLNIANRVFDQVGKGIVTVQDKLLLNVAKKAAAKIVGNKAAPLMPGDAQASEIANRYSRGTLINQQNRNLRTNVALAGAGSKNPITKGIAKLDAAYRGGGTYATSLGDLSTPAARETNMAILRQGMDEGITNADELEAYLTSKLGTPEYDNIYRRVENSYAGYIGMPESLTGPIPSTGKISSVLSKADNFIKNATASWPIPNRLKQELNDAIMPYLTGFSGSVSRMAKKGVNAGALGIPQIKEGIKMAASQEPGARAIGELMIARSLIDAVSAYGLAGVGAALAANGSWTGSYPSDSSEAARWQKEGIQPEAFQFNIGDKTVYIQPGRILGPLALPMVIPTVATHAIANGDSPQDAIGQVFNGSLGQFIQNMGVDAMGQTFKNVYDLGTGSEHEREEAGKNLLRTVGIATANAVTPAAGLANNLGNLTDDTKREADGVVDTIMSRNPVTRQSLNPRTDTLGNPIQNTTQMSLGSSTITVGDGQRSASSSSENESSDNLDGEINRLAKADFEVMPSREVKNSNSQSDAKALMGSKLYKSADDETKAAYLKEALLGTKTKDISKSLAAPERAALIEHKLQSEDQRKVWLEDNDNAANYYAANYNNKKANKTLTSDDDNLENKKGARYTMLRAQVDQKYGVDNALKQLYDDVSADEWKAMTNPESDDYNPEVAGRLAEYDKVRTEAGVSGKDANSSKPKYVLKTGKGGSGGGSGGGSDKFVFASLPSSLTGNTGNSSSKGYENSAPTFKPIADLKTSNAAEIPKGRTISIKKGIKL